MMGTEVVPETLGNFNRLTRLMAPEDFTIHVTVCDTAQAAKVARYRRVLGSAPSDLK